MPKVGADVDPHTSFTDHWIRVVVEKTPEAAIDPEEGPIELKPYFARDAEGREGTLYEALAYMSYGRSHGDLDAIERGVRTAQKTLKSHPTFGEAHLLLGQSLLLLGQVEDALPPLQQAVRLDDGDPRRLHALAQALELAQGDPAEIGAAAATCNLADNDPSLCIPDTPPFRALGVDPLCGLPLSTACVSSLLVEIISFETAVEDETVMLTWTTDRSTPDVRFDVERKAGEAFEWLGVVEGSAEATPAFTFRITGLARGTHTFRLKQVDINGSFRYSDEVTVLLVPGDVVVESAFPNPFRTATTLRFAVASEQEVGAELYNVMGRRVRTLYAGIPTANALQTLRIDGNGLPSGLYVVRITGASGFSTTEMVLLLK